jgi:outer membrane protein assembly factor BamB
MFSCINKFALMGSFALVIGCGPEDGSIAVHAPSASLSGENDLVATRGDWPWWRGPQHNGVAEEQEVPHRWDEETNVIWKVPLPGRGHATPIIAEGRIFLTTADDQKQTMSLLCLDRKNGQLLWEKTIHEGNFMHTHKKNSHASPTPAWDGNRVFAVFMIDDGIIVTALDRDGNIEWQTNAGPFDSKHGYGSSPVLYKSLVIINGDNQGSGFVTALDRKTGDIVWRIARTNNSSFATPVVAHLEGVDQLLLSGHNEICSYDPVDGRLRWKSEGPAATTANTMGWYKELVFASGGWPEQNLMAVRADGSGKIVWQKGIKAYVPSPLVTNGRLIVTQDANIVRCYDPESGEKLWVKRIGRRGYSASPTAVGDVVYLPDEEGNVHVFRAADKFEMIATNKLEGDAMASPVICDSMIYLRTSSHLYCIGRNRLSVTGESAERERGS